jgi:hypothetical protein
VSLSASMMTSLICMEQRGLGTGRVMIYGSRGEGAVWHHGGADGRLDKVGALIPPEGGLAEDGSGNKSVCGGAR